jgi:Mrp family chromosome partitioning ATPase
MAITNMKRNDGFNLLRPASSPDGSAGPVPAGDDDAWLRIPAYVLDERHLARHRVVSFDRHDPAHVAFDLLRTRLLQALKARGWSRVAITSPSKACGKTFVAANLALSLSRRQSCRAVLLDLDLRIPNLARVLGIRDTARTADFLTGACPPEALLRRVSPNLAVGAHAEPFPASAELLQEPSAVQALDRILAELSPDVVIYDLPPALACDDVLAILPEVDGVLLVAAGGRTSADEVRACERLFAGQVPLIGVILNKAEDAAIEPYYS